MEFNFDCIQSLDCDKDGFAILEGSYQNRIVPGYILFVKEILNMMGEASSKAQGLQTTITSADKFFSSNHRIFIKADKNKVLGFIKVGNKKLFLRDRNYNYHEVFPLCVLDFYVHESTQRRGIGKQLFDYMIKFEKKNPKELAYDRPSPKLISFLRKYFGLQGFIRQNNNFVVFDEFFSLIPSNINTTFDNDTNRAIQRLTTPLFEQNLSNDNYNNNRLNRNNNYSNIIEPNLSRTTPIPLSQNDINNYKRNNSQENIVYNNTFNDNVVNKDVYKNPNKGFQNYYFNNNETTAYDNIYSKRKMNLINDYLTSKKQTPYEYVHEQYGVKENSINNSNGRLNELMNKISDIRMENKYTQDQLYNKRNQFATLFDDKKLVEHNYKQSLKNNANDNSITKKDFQNYQENHIINGKKSPEILQHYTPFSNYGKVYTNILPTTSQAYGSYFNNSDINKREQSPNKIYY